MGWRQGQGPGSTNAPVLISACLVPVHHGTRGEVGVGPGVGRRRQERGGTAGDGASQGVRRDSRGDWGVTRTGQEGEPGASSTCPGSGVTR